MLTQKRRNQILSMASTIKATADKLEARKNLRRRMRSAATRHKALSAHHEKVGTARMQAYLKRYIREIVEQIKAIGQYPDSVDAIADVKTWNVKLMEVMGTVLRDSFADSMFSEYQSLGIDVDKMKLVATKTSTADEHLAQFEDFNLDDHISTQFGDVDLAMLTEFPEWMKSVIKDHLEESFEQDYWAEINAATTKDLNSFLVQHIQDGWGVEKLARKMMDHFDGAYTKRRARLILRTEMGHALNAGRSYAMDALIEENPTLIKYKMWLSVLGTTTRDSHADLDGVPNDKNNQWELGGVLCRWPSDISLPPSNRVNCQCTLVYLSLIHI